MSDVLHPTLVGRERELEILAELFAQLAGRGTALIVTGEPGVGKSALLGHAAYLAKERSMLILSLTGLESEARMPYAGLHQLLRPMLDQAAALSAPQREALSTAFGGDGEAPELFLVALATLNLLSDSATHGPILVVADDAHWLDGPTCDVLTFVARRLDSEPILLIASSRTGSETALDRAGLPELLLEGLGDIPAAALLDSVAPDLPRRVRERLLSEAAGNPLALVELPAAWKERGRRDGSVKSLPLTTKLERRFAGRARQLPEPTRRLLLIAALNDGNSVAEMLEAASLLPGERPGLADLEPAETSRLVSVEGQELRFRHPLIRSALRESASMSMRYAAHAALAQVTVGDVDRSVWHRAACTVGRDEHVAAELEATARRAQGRARGTVVAVDAMRQAANLTPDPSRRGARLLAAAELAFELRGDLVQELLEEAESLELSDSELRTAQWLREYGPKGRGEASVASLVAVAEGMRQDGERDRALRCLDVAAQKCYWFQSGPAERDLVIRALDRLALPPDDPMLMAIAAFADPIGRGAALIERAATVMVSAESDLRVLIRLGASLTSVIEFERATAILEPVLEWLRAQGRAGLVQRTLVSLGHAAYYSGDWDLAERSSDERIRMGDERGEPRDANVSRLLQAKMAAHRGDSDRADRLLKVVEELSFDRPYAPIFCQGELTRGTVALAAGRYEDAFARLRLAFDPSDRAGDLLIASREIVDLVEAAVHTGQQAEAQEKVAQLEPLAAAIQSPFLLASLRQVSPMLADEEYAESLFRASLDDTTGRPPFLQARELLHYGSWLRRHRRVADARPPLRSARDRFDEIGAVPWAERARRELRSTGENSPRRRPYRRDDLTPQETQIATMAAQGLTNREIGDRLFLSHRTVGSHLYRTFPKLGVSSRDELARAMTRAPQGPPLDEISD